MIYLKVIKMALGKYLKRAVFKISLSVVKSKSARGVRRRRVHMGRRSRDERLRERQYFTVHSSHVTSFDVNFFFEISFSFASLAN